MKWKITICTVYVLAAITSVCLLESFPTLYRSNQLALGAIACALLVASVLQFRWPRLSHGIGFLTALGASYWFYRIEFGYRFPGLNTWIAFNLPDGWPGSSQEILIAKLKIAFAITAVAATSLSATRLLPASWIVRKRPVRERLWPTLAVCISAALFWYVLSVSPYRIPLIVDAVTPRLTLLHIEKIGRQFHEKGIGVFQDGRVYSFSNDRRLFQYRFPVHAGSATLPPESTTRGAAFGLAEKLGNAHTATAVPLSSRKAEGWYVRTQSRHVFAFTTENGTPPPPELLTLFRALESAAPTTKRSGDGKDICFGFCYDPLAGLGIRYMNDRCIDQNRMHCE